MDQDNDSMSDLPEVASDYINAVIKKMRYRRKVRQEVKEELSAHFADALRQFDDQQQRQLQAEQLVALFGDAKTLATLLRRAKKRCRPMWRTALARTFQATGIMVLLLVVYIVWFFSGTPSITTNYIARLNELVRPGVDDSHNAMPFYERAAEQYTKLPEGFSLKWSEEPGPVDEQQKTIIQKWIDDNSQSLELVRQGTEKQYYWPHYGNPEGTGPILAMVMPNLLKYRQLSRALCWRGVFAAGAGQYDKTADDMITSYRLGRHLRGDTVFIEQLVGIAIETRTVKMLRAVVAQNELDDTALARLQGRLAEATANEQWTVSLKGEKLGLYDVIQRSFVQTRLGSHLYLRRMYGNIHIQNTRQIGHILFNHPDMKKTRKQVDRIYEIYEKRAQLTPASARPNIEQERQEIEGIMKDNLLIGTFMPAFDRVITIFYRVPIEVDATLAVLALQRYKLRHGDYPDGLEELVKAGLLKAVPIDPFSDKPIAYRSGDEDFLLYSFGYDCVDDDGTPGMDSKGRIRQWGWRDSDTVFWPIQHE